MLDIQWHPYLLKILIRLLEYVTPEGKTFLIVSPSAWHKFGGGGLIKTITRLTILHYFKIVLLT